MPEHESHAPSEPIEPNVSSVSPDGLVPEVVSVEAPTPDLPERSHAFIEATEALTAVEGPSAYFEAAVQLAASIQGASDRSKAQAAIGTALARSGDRGGAQEAFAEAMRSAAENEHSQYRSLAQGVIARAQVRAGDMDGALQTAAVIEEVRDRCWVQLDIATAQADAGDIDNARQTVAIVRQPRVAKYLSNDLTLQKVLVTAQAKSGDIEGARQTAAGIDNSISRPGAEQTIATAQANSGDIEGALLTAAGIEDSGPRVKAEVAIAAAQTEAGDMEAAQETLAAASRDAMGIERSAYLVALQASIATAQAESGNISGARETLAAAKQTAAGIEDSASRAAVQTDIATALVQAGDPNGAKETFAAALQSVAVDKDHIGIVLVQVAIATAQAKAGYFDGALQAAGMIDSIGYRVQAQVAIATAQAEAGNMSGAEETFAAAKQTAEEGNDDSVYHEIDQTAIAKAQAQNGDIVDAKQLADTFGPDNRSAVYTAIAMTLSKTSPEAEQIDVVSQLKGLDRQINVGAFWPEIAADPRKSLVLAREIRSSDQALAMLANFDVGTKDLSSAARGEVMSQYLDDLALTHGLDSTLYEVNNETNDAVSVRHLWSLINYDVSSELLRDAFERGFPMAEIARHSWLLDPELITENDPYPLKRGIAEQNRYLADHSFTDLAGFNRSTIGKLIHSRLDSTAEANLHDASQWLSTFALSETTIAGAYDARRLKEVGAEGSDINLDDFREPLWNEDAATDLLASMINLPEDQHHRLPGNTSPQDTGRYEDMLWQPAHTLVYRALLEHGINHPTAEQLRAYADDLIEDYWQTQPELMVMRKDQPVIPASREALSRQVHELIARSYLRSVQGELESPSKYIGELKSRAKSRKAYIDDATTWLNRHADAPQQIITKAWQDRPLALADGCPDKATAIIAWASANAVRLEARQMADADGIIHHHKGDFDTRRLTGELQAFTAELSRCYGAEETIHALMKLDRQPAPEMDLPPANLELLDGYRFEILSKDDPRGFTIGHDTGCCMELNGAADSCVWAGYRDRRYGFAALYGPDGRLQAQSLVYHNPDENSDVLVLDNIEANAGRDLRQVRERYIEALTKYLAPDGSAAGKWKRVQVGEGYSDVSLSDLPKAEAVPTPKRGTYSDSHKQRLLLELE